MPFKPGQSGNPGGRSSPRMNRAREAIAKCVDQNADKIAGWMDEIAATEGPRAALSALTGLIEFCVPKLARTELAGDPDAPLRLLTEEQIDAQIAQYAAKLAAIPPH